MKILANDGLSASGIAAIEAAGHTVLTDHVEANKLEQFINENNITAVLVRSATKIRQPLIDACPGMKLIIRGGVGMDNIDVAYARENGVQVSNTPASSSQSVAELVMGHLFSVARFFHESHREMPSTGAADFKRLKKAYGKGIELRGKTLAIIGFGRIGQSLAGYALGCGMKVIAVDRQVGSQEIKVSIAGKNYEVEVQKVTLAEAMQQADMLSLHIPAQSDGSAVIDAAAFGEMKDGIIIVNASRGGTMDEDALLAALDSGKIRGVGLDVFVGEPQPRADLLSHPRVSATPHIGAATNEAQDRIGLEIASIVCGFAVPATIS